MNLVKRLKEKEANCQPVDDHLSLSLLPDLLGHHLGSLHVAAEHHHLDERRTIESLFKTANVSEDHLGAPPAHVEGGELANASVAASDRHNLAVQPRFAGALSSLRQTWLRSRLLHDRPNLHEPPEEVEEESDNKNPSKKSAYPSTSKSSTLKSHDWPQESVLSAIFS